MPDFSARIGSFDLSEFVRVSPGEGLDPYDAAGFEDPAWTSSPFGEGESLSNVDSRNREMVFPLYLNSVESGQNRITNPRAELDTTGWTNSGLTTFERAASPAGGPGGADWSFHGVGNANNDLAYIAVPVVNGVQQTWSAWVYVASQTGGAVPGLYAYNSGFSAIGNTPHTAGVGAWQRLTLTVTPTSTGTFYLAIRQVGGTALDCSWTQVMAADGAVAAYGDGDAPGWSWSGAPHASASARPEGKVGLHAIIRDLNRAIRNPDGQLTLRWQDVGASDPTFYDVAYARFDPEFSLRQAAQGWLAGTLRVWCQPGYGHTGTYRVVGTAAGVAGPASIVMPSMAGDIEATPLVYVGATYPTVNSLATGMRHGVFVARTRPGQGVFLAASSIQSVGATLLAASGAIGTRAIVSTAGTNAFQLAVVPNLSPSAYAGRNRMLLLMQMAPARVATVTFYEKDANDGYVEESVIRTAVPTALPSGVWGAIDLGVVDIDPFVNPATRSYRIVVGADGGSASAVMRINGLYVLPEDRSLVIRDKVQTVANGGEGGLATYAISHGSVIRRSTPSGMAQWGVAANADLSGLAVGGVPGVTPGASDAIAVGHFPLGDGAFQPNLPIGLEISVRERFTFAR